MPLDRATLSAIGHAGLPFWSPVPAATLDALLDRLAPPRGAHVLDLGCGDGAMLAHVTRRLGGPGTGVDHDPGALALARRHEGTLRWIERPADLPVDAPPVDLLVAIGSVSPADLIGANIGAPRVRRVTPDTSVSSLVPECHGERRPGLDGIPSGDGSRVRRP